MYQLVFYIINYFVTFHQFLDHFKEFCQLKSILKFDILAEL